jgi:hypothetical protein
LTRGGRFCTLGAGNCNDLELPRLLDAFDEVHLVDIDPHALNSAVARQGVDGAAGLALHAPVDLTGIADRVTHWKACPPTPADVRQAVEVSDGHPQPFDISSDVVLSCCVVSQLVGYASDALGGDRHPGFRELVQAIRARHLRLMVDSLKPGGTGLLVCDLVSSDSQESLPRVPEHELPGLIGKLARDGNFFSGLFPDAMLTTCHQQSGITDARLLAPWLWRLGPRRTFLVYAIRFRRATGRAPRLILP